MQIRLDQRVAPFATPIAKEKIFFCDFERDKNYLAFRFDFPVTKLTDLNLFYPQTDFTDPLYDQGIIGLGTEYRNILQTVVNNGYLIDFIKVQFGNASDAERPFHIIDYDASGVNCDDLLIPRLFLDSQQISQGLINIDLKETPLLLDGLKYINWTLIEGQEPVTFIFQYRKRILKSDALKIHRAFL